MKKGLNYRFILKTLGFLLIIEALFMLLTSCIAIFYNDPDYNAFLWSVAITATVGIIFSVIGIESKEEYIGKREGFLVVTLSWMLLSACGMLPFVLSGAVESISDAYFETMSGFTTTGSTIIAEIETLPHALLFWRALTQWIGGLGIIVFALALLPTIGGNASFLYEAETTGVTHERFQPRIIETSKRLIITYTLITVIVVGLLYVGPMSLFDSICHAMSAVSTGGFSTKGASIAYWNSPYIEYVITAAMFICGINFTLLYFLLKGKPSKLFKDEEFRWYLGIYVFFTLVVTIGLVASGQISIKAEAFRTAIFQVTSAISTTGFSTANFTSWGPLFMFLFYFIMIICACAGSTSGGVKVIRFVILVKNAVNQFKLQVHPNAILPVRINEQVVSLDIVTKVLAFLFLYLAILFISFLILSITGVGFSDAITISISSLGNVGLGNLADASHWGELSNSAKWFLSMLMLTGRLELFTVLSLFIPGFWKK